MGRGAGACGGDHLDRAAGGWLRSNLKRVKTPLGSCKHTLVPKRRFRTICFAVLAWLAALAGSHRSGIRMRYAELVCAPAAFQ